MSGAKEKKKIGLTTQIFIALIVGAILGIVLHVAASDVEFVQNVLINGVFYVIGQGFIRLMQMLVVPLVFCSLICGATAIGDSKTLGKVGIKIIGFYILTTMMAVAVALGIGLLIRPGIGLDMSQVQQVETGIEGGQSVSFAETILNIIPKNPIGALANGEMLQVIVFALIVGIILAKLQDKTQLVTNFFQQGNDIMMEMTMMVMRLAPRRILPDRKDVRWSRLLRDGSDVQVYGRGSARAVHPVLRRIPDSACAVYAPQSAALPQEVCSGYGLRLLDGYFQCDDPDEYRHAGGKDRR